MFIYENILANSDRLITVSNKNKEIIKGFKDRYDKG
jgi:hypothetical protein